MILAAIDIGSNACRLLIAEVLKRSKGKPVFQKQNLIRVPLRLGFDVFDSGEISKEKRKLLLETIKAYAHLMKAYGVSHHIAVGTSAMRDAKNTADVIRRVYLETGIKIDVISGDMEAMLIYESHVAERLNTENNYLYIDVGGGSTELTFFCNGEMVYKRSFNIGTIRLLKSLVDDKEWVELKQAITENIKGIKGTTAIGTGGNINKVFSMSKRKEGKPLSIDLLREYHKEFTAYTVEDRMQLFSLRRDRADVIVPALQIYIQVMKWASIEDILVPKIGLADGLIQHLYYGLGDNI